jgi:TolB-like protein/tetratricopeptide (TPR) repeat protein
VFLSYASQDAMAAQRICAALRSAGVEVWFDQSELRGGDAWDRQIRKQIHDCALFVPLISQHSQERLEGYFRLEWKLAVDRSHRMAAERSFIVPVVVDSTRERDALVPDSFRDVQWTHLLGGEASPVFVARVSALLGAPAPVATAVGPDSALVGAPSARTRNPRAVWIPLGAAVFAIILGGGWLALQHSGLHRPAPGDTAGQSQPAVGEKSIAVLPFVDLSEKHDQEYFADGMTEEIIDLLARVPDLRVPARTSSFYFKGKSTKVSDIARELGVAQVLEGSIRRSGDKIRVTAQLVRADNGYHLWSQTYDRDLHDVFKVQDDIANAVVQALQITLMGGPLSRRRGGTENLEAYQLYLRGLSSMFRNTTASLAAARDYFDQAVKLDPGFGLAWAEQSRDAIFLTESGVLSPKEGFESARQLANRALQASPDLPEAHAMLGYVHRSLDWDWSAADTEFRQALALDPTNATALMFAGQLSYTLGRWDECDRQLRLALVRDPLLSIAIWSLGTCQYLGGRFADAEATYRRLIELEPGFAWTHMYLGKALLAAGKPEAALAAVRQEPDEESRLDFLPITLEAAGHQAEADEALKALITKFGDSSYMIAMTYAYRDDHELGFNWLERAYQAKDVSLVEIVGEPFFKNIAKDPRYRAFLRKMNLPE